MAMPGESPPQAPLSPSGSAVNHKRGPKSAHGICEGRPFGGVKPQPGPKSGQKGKHMADKRPDFTPDRKPVRDVAELPDGGAGFEACAMAIDAGVTPSDDGILRIGEAVAELGEHMRDLKAFAGKPVGGRAEDHDDGPTTKGGSR